MTRPTHTSAPLGAALDDEDGVFGLSAEMLSLIAARLEEALSDARDAPLAGLKGQLGEGLRAALARAPEEVIAAIRAASATDPHRNAYLLGQIGMAHNIAMRAGDRRLGEAFGEALASDGLAPYVAALLEGQLTNSELAARTGERLETVSRKLRKLRDLGAADFRRDGQMVHNFLTAPAQAVARANVRPAAPLPRPKRVLDDLLTRKMEAIDAHMNAHQNFSTDGAYSELPVYSDMPN